MDWYYASNGQQAGPVSQEELAELFRNGTVKPFDLVWNETMAEWTPIGKMTDFALSSPPAPAPAPVTLPLETPKVPEEPKLFDTPPPASPSFASGGYAPVGGPVSQGMPEPSSYLWQSIVVTVLCCLPFGIPAIIFSTKVKPAYLSGDYQGSLDASKKAKMWCLIALILGLIANLLIIGIQIAAVFSGAALQPTQ
jgi:hypothetical protein